MRLDKTREWRHWCDGEEAKQRRLQHNSATLRRCEKGREREREKESQGGERELEFNAGERERERERM